MSNPYAEAADALASEHAPSWRPAKPEEGHPAQIGGPIIRIGSYDKNGTSARVYTIRTEFQSLAGVQNTHWSIWAFAPNPGQTESRMTRLINELGLEVGDKIVASFAGRKAFSDGSGKSWLDFTFARLDSPGPDELAAQPVYDDGPGYDPTDGFGEVPV